MFASVERRLAILNVSVVVAIVGLIGLGTWLLLSRSLDQEADASLETRIQSVRESLAELPQSSDAESITVSLSSEDHDDDDADDEDHDRESRQVVISGDTLTFVFDADGNLVTDRRNVATDHIPDHDGVEAALDGETDTRFVTINGERIRVRTEPVYADREVVGAIQAVRSESEHDDELALVRNVTLIGTGIGVLVAVPAGVYLTRRAMAPINDVMHRQRAFVADAAHELRTPLTVIRANAEVVSRTPDLSQPDLTDEMQAMITDIDAMSRLVDELLTLSRVDDLGHQVELRDMPLLSAIERAAGMLSPEAQEAGITLSVSKVDAVVRGDPGMVSQVLRIVIENAIRYTPANGTVNISTHQERGLAIVEIRDTGIGIQPEDLPYVFDRFYRVDKARTRSTGTGLGLSIARGLMTALNGTISLQSTPCEGTTATLTFPLAHKSG